MENEIVIVPEQDVQSAGAVVYWTLSGNTNRHALSQALDADGFDGEAVPLTPNPGQALQRALHGFGSTRTMARSVSRTQYSLVNEHVEDGKLRYDAQFTVSVDALGQLGFEGTEHQDPGLPERITNEYVHNLASLSCSDISSWIIRTAHSMHAVALRERGGLYFIPRAHVAQWNAFTEAVRGASKHTFYAIPAMDSQQAVESVLDSVLREATTAIDSIESELQGELGERALKTRSKTCESMLTKLNAYTDLLGDKLDDIKLRTRSLKGDVAAAMLANMGEF